MVVCDAKQTKARPLEFIQDPSRRSHVGSTAHRRAWKLEVVDQHLEVRKRRVGAPDTIEHLKISGLVVDRDAAVDDGIAREREAKAIRRRRCLRRRCKAQTKKKRQNRTSDSHAFQNTTFSAN